MLVLVNIQVPLSLQEHNKRLLLLSSHTFCVCFSKDWQSSSLNLLQGNVFVKLDLVLFDTLSSVQFACTFIPLKAILNLPKCKI